MSLLRPLVNDIPIEYMFFTVKTTCVRGPTLAGCYCFVLLSIWEHPCSTSYDCQVDTPALRAIMFQASGKPSTWFPPVRLVERYKLEKTFSKFIYFQFLQNYQISTWDFQKTAIVISKNCKNRNVQNDLTFEHCQKWLLQKSGCWNCQLLFSFWKIWFLFLSSYKNWN